MRKISKQEYKKLFDQAEFKTFFHDPNWHKFLEKEFKWLKFEYYDNLPVARVNKKLISLPFCEYGGPLGDFNEQDILEEFGENIKIKFHPQINVGSLASNMVTYWIEDFDKLSFRKTLRHSIRKAEQRDIQIKKCQNLADLKRFYDLYLVNLKKHKTVPYPYSIVKFLYNSADSELLLAWHKGRIIAGSLFLYYDKFVHYFLSASDYKYRNLGANYLILWEKIKSLRGKDKILDLGAAPKGSSLEIFKRGWGGKEYPIAQIGIKKSEEKLRSSKLREIWSLLPNFVIKKLSSKFIKYRL